MLEDDKLFPDIGMQRSIVYAERASIAYQLIQQYALIAGKSDGEDSANRQKYDLQHPEEIVNRAFQIADLFVAKALERGELKRVSIQEAASGAGEYDRIRERTLYKKDTAETPLGR